MEKDTQFTENPNTSARPSENVKAGQPADTKRRIAVSQMEGIYRNKELSLPIQFAAIFTLWFVWLATAVFVVWRERTLNGPPLYAKYSDPFTVYFLALVAMPLVLVAIGKIFLRRVRTTNEFRFVQRTLYSAVGFLTVAGIAVSILASCFLVLWVMTPKARE